MKHAPHPNKKMDAGRKQLTYWVGFRCNDLARTKTQAGLVLTFSVPRKITFDEESQQEIARCPESLAARFVSSARLRLRCIQLQGDVRRAIEELDRERDLRQHFEEAYLGEVLLWAQKQCDDLQRAAQSFFARTAEQVLT